MSELQIELIGGIEEIVIEKGMSIRQAIVEAKEVLNCSSCGQRKRKDF